MDKSSPRSSAEQASCYSQSSFTLQILHAARHVVREAAHMHACMHMLWTRRHVRSTRHVHMAACWAHGGMLGVLCRRRVTRCASAAPHWAARGIPGVPARPGPISRELKTSLQSVREVGTLIGLPSRIGPVGCKKASPADRVKQGKS